MGTREATSTGMARDPAADDKLYAILVGALYDSRKSLIGASLVAVLISLAAFADRDDIVYLQFGIAFLVVSTARVGANYAYERASREGAIRSQRPWEMMALAGAWSFSAATGCLAAYSAVRHSGESVELLTNCCAFGYIAGISSRNASRPLITVGQISAIAIPFVIGLLVRPDLVHIALAAFVTTLFASTIVMTRSMHENIVERHHAHAELERAALFDPLTALKNRMPFIKLVNGLCATLGPESPLALLAIDLDRFKAVNDRFGHPAGDRVLVEATRRIAAAIEVPHEAARVGGDEFLVAIPQQGTREALATAERIRAVLAEDYLIGHTVVACGGSIGLAVGPEFGRTYDALMRGADLALYTAKNQGRGGVVVYSAEIGEAFDARSELEEDLRSACARGELSLVYQPVVQAATGRIIGCEALMRWTQATRGSISPAEFIPIAEATGLIVDLGRWALDAACRDAATWDPAMRVSVNLSPLQVAAGDELLEHVRSALAVSGLAPHRLELEVTESLLIGDTRDAAAVIEALRAMGVGVALDDFGAGYSSLGYLRDFDFTKVKIDRKLCSRIDLSPRSRSVVRCVIQLASDLGLEVVAEGIEEMDDLRAMRDLGVPLVQGFIYSRPLSATHIADFLRVPVIQPRLARRETSAVAAWPAARATG